MQGKSRGRPTGNLVRLAGPARGRDSRGGGSRAEGGTASAGAGCVPEREVSTSSPPQHPPRAPAAAHARSPAPAAPAARGECGVTRLWEYEALPAHARNHAHLDRPLRARPDGDAARHQPRLSLIPLLAPPGPRLQRRVRVRHLAVVSRQLAEPPGEPGGSDYHAGMAARTGSAHTGRACVWDPRCSPGEAQARAQRLGASQGVSLGGARRGGVRDVREFEPFLLIYSVLFESVYPAARGGKRGAGGLGTRLRTPALHTVHR